MIAAALIVLLGAAPGPEPPPPPRLPAAAVTVRLLLRPGAPSEAPKDPWFGPDKVKHFFLSAFVHGVAFSALRGARVERGTALAGASVAAVGLGLGKELHDWRVRREFSGRDLLWNVAGAAAAGVVMAHTLR